MPTKLLNPCGVKSARNNFGASLAAECAERDGSVLVRSKAIQIVGGLIIVLLLFQLTLTALDLWEDPAPSAWILSYINPQGRSISEPKRAPMGDGFIEDYVDGPVTVELTLPQCRAYDRYRFWVGPYGNYDLERQPRIWNVWVQSESGEWLKASSEEMREKYSNNHWYTFPLNYDLPCVRRMRMEIIKLTGSGNLFRLFAIQVYRSTFLDWMRGL